MRFVKGHGTQNDFVLLPDAGGTAGSPAPELVRQLCERRAGLGADGVIRVVRTAADDDPAAVAARREAEWFMDYRNADGSLSEMCGNGIRVLGRFLALQKRADAAGPLPIATRDGVKVLRFAGGRPHGDITVDMGVPQVRGDTVVEVGSTAWPATCVDIGNPHAVAFVDDLDDAGPLLCPPVHDADLFPEGVNVEFVVRRGPQHLGMRVHERGSGETRSCGTGACAVVVAAATDDQAERGTAYRVDLPGGTLSVTWTQDDHLLMTGPAVLVAEGNWFAGR